MTREGWGERRRRCRRGKKGGYVCQTPVMLLLLLLLLLSLNMSCMCKSVTEKEEQSVDGHDLNSIVEADSALCHLLSLYQHILLISSQPRLDFYLFRVFLRAQVQAISDYSGQNENIWLSFSLSHKETATHQQLKPNVVFLLHPHLVWCELILVGRWCAIISMAFWHRHRHVRGFSPLLRRKSRLIN